MLQSVDLDTRISAAETISPLHPVGATAVRLIDRRGTDKTRPLVFVAQTARRAADIAAILRALEPAAKVAYFPPWDCLPYDGLSPSRAVMGQRMGVLRWLTNRKNLPEIVVTTAEALVRRVPPRSIWKTLHREFRAGEAFDVKAMRPFLQSLGYLFDDRVDEPGEAAIRGRVVDFFPAGGDLPCRIEHEKGRIVSIRSYDPVTQRTIDEIECLIVDPASEIVGDETAPEPVSDARLAKGRRKLETVFDYLGAADLLLEEGADRRAEAFIEAAEAAHEEAREASSARARADLPAPSKILLTSAQWREQVARSLAAVIDDPAEDDAERVASLRNLAAENAPWAALRDLVGQGKTPLRVVIAAGTRALLNDWHRRARRNLGGEWERATGWSIVETSPAGSNWSMLLPISEGFVLRDRGVVVVTPQDLGGRTAANASGQGQAALLAHLDDYEIGDAVVHIDHGVGILRGLETIERDGRTMDALRLSYADDASLLVPMEEIGALWRYGADPGDLKLDRLKGEGWLNRRNDLLQRVQDTARGMVDLMSKRRRSKARALKPERRTFERFCAGFPHALSPDQSAAVDAVLADLASGRPMDRLVCGDVGFGKTEVGFRAAAVAVSAGRQAAIIAPTTVLAQQHTRAALRRFRSLGIEVAHLSRLTAPDEAKRVKAGLKSGEIRLVVGTHALCAEDIAFKDLALVVIDEEQRFGARHKSRLRALAPGGHVLTMTATPIPRTLQASFVGLNDISVIATPPVLRRPIRTILAPFDDDVVRDALQREKRRKGQSFVVCPRVEDIAPMADRLKALVPELEVAVVHGKLPVETIDEVMLRFGEGGGDVLLATNIIESGLDVPAANTMIVWRPDRFGLAQLHQLRGRVGRGSRRGTAFLLTDPAVELGETARSRLQTLERLSGLGAGFTISTRDLDLRGAGELLGEEQAGHLQLVGLSLYRHLIERALVVAEGKPVADDWTPDIVLGASGSIPADYVPDPAARINLYSRIDRLRERSSLELLVEEIGDRFGPIPAETKILLKAAELRLRCRELGVQKLASGPKGTAAAFRTKDDAARHEGLKLPAGWKWNDTKLVSPKGGETVAERFVAARSLLETIDAPAA
ncbi:DEAD/DEAH box helicase [Aureimonas sp. Leaf324]|uniref:DEAD/DEAH box helicase n=1 Tax=Aureimonas sp. Leaf324 TaxID=1736336 RepID=UPI0006F73E56|nr:DEAD/DEAH box helicase [Aureimonas sp. Leaf324]KQQ85588.1 DEAD/DEAH box helicase [Aureimonas sp. Leaf324]